MSNKPIDLAAVREAHANLDRLAKEHPELLGQSSPEEWETLLKQQDASERQKRWQARQHAAGNGRANIWLPEQTLAALREHYPGPRGGVDWAGVAAAALKRRGARK